MNKSSFRRKVALMIAAAVALAACGDSGDTSSGSRARNAALQVSNVAISKPISVAAGVAHSLALDDKGAIVGWGINFHGQSTPPTLRDGGTRFTDIAAGFEYSLALDDKGQLYRTGPADFALPVPTAKASKFTAISGGSYHGLALDDNGNIYAWGWNDYGQTVVPNLRDGGTKFTSIAAGHQHTLALDDNGNIYAWGWDDYGQTVVPNLRDGGTKFTSIAAGFRHSVALDDNGNIYAWGWNGNGQTVVPNLRDGGTKFTSISGGSYHGLALDDNGNIYAWGWNGYGQTVVPNLQDGGTKFTSIAAGHLHTLALDDNGNIYAWGWNGYGQTNVPSVLSPVYARSMPIAMGGISAYGIEDTGTITTFSGQNTWLENSNYISIATGPRHGLAVTRSGTVEGWGDYEVGQLDIPYGLSNVVQVAAGYAYSVALKSDGAVVEWGAHTAPTGKLITKPNDLPKIRHLAGGLTHVLAITVDGKVVAWGDNSLNKASPPEGLDEVIAVAANRSCSMALRRNGDLVFWGGCQTSVEEKTSLPGASMVAMSDLSAAAIVNGTIVTWGEDANDLLTAPGGNNYAALVAGTAAFLAVTTDGNVVSWGNNSGESITIPETFGGPAPIVNDGICLDCPFVPEEFVWTDEMLEQDAAFYAWLLTPEQRAKFIEALGGNTAKPLSPEEIQDLVDAATAAEREKSRQALAAALAAQSAPVASVAKALPASKSPLTKVGARITTKKAVTLLGLKKVTKVSFVKPKKASAVCTVTATRITTMAAGTCNVKVRYTDSKKKVLTKTLTLSIG